MKYLLRGGEFNNKGSEAMTLVAISQIVSRDNDAIIYLVDYDTRVPYIFNCNVSIKYFPQFILNEQLKKKSLSNFFLRLKDTIKFFIPGKVSTFLKRRRIKTIVVKLLI